MRLLIVTLADMGFCQCTYDFKSFHCQMILFQLCFMMCWPS